MAYGICVEVWGDRALFTRPELSVERVSYDAMDSQRCERAAREHLLASGHALHHRPYPCAQSIRFTNVRRNEVKSKALASTMRTAATGGGKLPYINTKDDIQQRASLILIDVRYVIEAHFDLTDKATPDDNAGKFKDIIRRRLERGQCYSMPTSEHASSRRISKHAKRFRHLAGSMQTKANVTSASCCTTWTTAIRRTLPLCSSARSCATGDRRGGKRGVSMILQALVGFYEQLAKEHLRRSLGWGGARVRWRSCWCCRPRANWSMLFHPMRSAVGR